jgi:hypothetical protein
VEVLLGFGLVGIVLFIIYYNSEVRKPRRYPHNKKPPLLDNYKPDNRSPSYFDHSWPTYPTYSKPPEPNNNKPVNPNNDRPTAAIKEQTYRLGPQREPLLKYTREQVYKRANQQCENPFCHAGGRLHIHHIDMNHENNKLYNLIALCPYCHEDAHSGKFPPTQVHNWMSMDYHQLKLKQTKYD